MIRLDDSIETLDPKSSLCFLDKHDLLHETSDPINIESSFDENIIWKIENFLSHRECDEIIDKSEKNGFQYLNYRKSERLIAIDDNANLMKTIKHRLNDKLFNKDFYENKWERPHGFYTDLIDWDKDIKINSCIRINKYNNSEFKLHRDAQFTESYFVRSKYTIIIYLNDDYEHGSTCFYVPKHRYPHNGETIEEEILNKEYECIKIKPKKGTVIMFDQKLIHEGLKMEGTKYILRTDIIATSDKCIDNKNLMTIINTKEFSLEKKIENLTKSIFRQAQYNELNGLPCSDLYERSISLKQDPGKLTTYPIYLESLIQYETIHNYITSELTYISRSANTHKFEYETKLNNKFNLLKTAALFSILFLTKSKKKLIEKNDEILEIINNEGQTNIKGNSFGHAENSYYFNYSKNSKEDSKKDSKKDHYNKNNPFSILNDDDSNGSDDDDSNGSDDDDDDDDDNDNSYKKAPAVTNKLDNVPFIPHVCLFDETMEKNKGMSKCYNSLISLYYYGGKSIKLPSIYKFNQNITTTTDNLPLVLKYLFDVNYDIRNDVPENVKNIKPLSTILKSHVNIYDIKTKDCDEGCCRGGYIQSFDKEYVHGYSFDVVFDNYVMNLSNIIFNKSTITGKIDIELPSKSFNHASSYGNSCTGLRRKHVYVDSFEQKILILNYEIDFIINSTEIILHIVPMVVV
jgi:prolyl 4-hydroxylase